MRLEVLRAVGATAWGPVDGREDDTWQYSERAGPGLVGGRLPTLAPAAVGGLRGVAGVQVGRLWQPDQAAAATVHEVTRLEGRGA